MGTKLPTTVQTELRVARSYLQEAEGKLHAAAEVIFTLSRRTYPDPVPYAKTFTYGWFFGSPPGGEREAPPLDVGTKKEYRAWVVEASRPISQDLAAAVERLRSLVKQYPGAALIEDGERRAEAAAMLGYAYLLWGDYYFYRCDWRNAQRQYRAAFQLLPQGQEALFRLALAFVNDGDLARAHNFLERAVETLPFTDLAIEARKELERLENLRGGRKIFRGSPPVFKTLLAISGLGLLAGLSCAACGVLGLWAEMSGEADAEAATAWLVVCLILAGLAVIVPASVTAVYYFAKRR